MRSLDEAIAAGISFLRAELEQQGTGLWRDFAFPGVSAGSTECISAFIAAQIGPLPEGRGLAASVVENVLTRARQTGGWGYREDVPEDCDSTAWVLLAAAAARVDLPPAVMQRSTSFIVGHQHTDGGFMTYAPAAKQSLTPADQPGWFEPELSVTASAALALATTDLAGAPRVRAACRYIARARHDDLWRSYWWKGFGYATHLALLALSQAGRGQYERHAALAGQAILTRRSAAGGWANERDAADNGFSTSFALRALLLFDRAPERDASLSYLCGLIAPGGGCPPSAEMLAPGAANGSDVVLRDGGCVTTACVVRALHEARTLGAGQRSARD